MEAVNTLGAAKHIDDLSVFGDGKHDYVYAHFLLPHIPYIVDSTCYLVPMELWARSDHEHHRIREQLACVDSLLLDVVEGVDRDTAVLIAGDHGTGEGGQVGTPFEDWSDADIGERLGALLAYRLPQGCAEPEEPTNVYAMRAIMECTVIADLPTEHIGFLVGADQPKWVSSERVSSISTQLAEGTMPGPN